MRRRTSGRRKLSRQLAARVAPWSGAERAANWIRGVRRDRDGGRRADGPPGRRRAGPVVEGTAAALHGVGAGRPPANPAGVAALHVKHDLWLQVGGHADPGEADPLEIALREAAEETGLT